MKILYFRYLSKLLKFSFLFIMFFFTFSCSEKEKSGNIPGELIETEFIPVTKIKRIQNDEILARREHS